MSKYEIVDITKICNAENIGRPTTFAGELSNKEEVPYIGYSELRTSCTPNDNSQVCARCPAMAQGSRYVRINASNAAMLNFVRTSADRVSSALKAAGGIPNKCGNVNIDKDVSKVNLTCGVVTPITEYVGKLAADIESLYSVMVPIVIINETSKLEDNKTYHFDGYTHRDPHTGRVVFLCERVRPRDDDIKSYKLDDDKWERLKKFRPKNWKEKTISSKINDVLYELKVNHHKMNKRNEIALADRDWETSSAVPTYHRQVCRI